MTNNKSNMSAVVPNYNSFINCFVFSLGSEFFVYSLAISSKAFEKKTSKGLLLFQQSRNVSLSSITLHDCQPQAA